MTTIIFASHGQQQCGVHQFGKQIFEVLERSSKFQFIYCELSDASELRAAVVSHNPSAVIINFHPMTIGWAQGWASWSLQIPSIGIMHEMTAAVADQMDNAPFDYYILHDPSAETQNPLFFKAARLIHPPSQPASLPARFTIGSFGFATPGKGFEAVAARAHAEFDDCLIRFNIPSSEFCDKDGSQARLAADRCRSLIVKPGVQIEITHDFLDLNGVERFLAGNSINAFFYDEQEGRGISSAVDLALSARRPIAARRTSMVRHLFKAEPSIFIEDRSLREIAESGLAPLKPFIDHWTAESVLADYENMLDTIFSNETPQARQLRWFKRVADVDAAIKRAEELEAILAEREANFAEREANFAERDRQLVNDLKSEMEGSSRFLRLGLSVARRSREASRLVRKILGPKATSRLRRLAKIVHLKPPMSSSSPVQDISHLLHDSRSSRLRRMPKVEGTMLSAGCSGTWYFNWIRERTGHVGRHIGIEFYSPKPGDLPANVEWIANTIGDMNAVASDECELVFSGENLEHLWPEDVVGFFLESWRVLKPGGHLVIDSPNRLLTEPYVWSHPEHTVEVTPGEAKTLAELAGFEVTALKGIWLCRDPVTKRLFPLDPNIVDAEWSLVERVLGAEDDPDNSFLWWLEAVKHERGPDANALTDAMNDIYETAWPQRSKRFQIVGDKIEENGIVRVRAKKGIEGVIIYGPYMPLKKGRHSATFQLFAAKHKDQNAILIRCDILGSGGREIAVKDVSSADLATSDGAIRLEFELAALEFGIQARCISFGACDVECTLPVIIV